MNVGPKDGWLGLSRGREGLQRSSESLNRAARDVVSATIDSLNGTRLTGTDATVVRIAPDMDEALLSAKKAEHAYAANARSVRVSDATIESMLEMMESQRDAERDR